MHIYVASSNPGKLRDFAHAVQAAPHAGPHQPHAGTPIAIQPLPGLDRIPPPPEDEPTFEGNAREKAFFYSRLAPGHYVLADDSGLEVACLDGAPGVRSARYAGDREAQGFPAAPGATLDERNNAALLHALDAIPGPRRHARYRCVLALARDGRLLATAEGSLEGAILTAPRGTLGFGYDPLFFLPELARTMAELDPATRLEFSHRGRALRRLLHLLPRLDLPQ